MLSNSDLNAVGEAAPRALCVSIHDVSPHTWQECRLLLDMIASVAPIPVTLLVVPHYHRRSAAGITGNYDNALTRHVADGGELALHGYTHLDESDVVGSWRHRFIRRLYTQGEGEFSALDKAEAARRIQLGLAWFAARGWPVEGFVAPAWLLSKESWQALDESPLRYTTTMRRFHLLRGNAVCHAPSLVHAARNAPGRYLSRAATRIAATLQRSAPLVRFGLHPRDARHPSLVAHARQLLLTILQGREAMTKADFARQLESQKLIAQSNLLQRL